jgi:RNA polymerase sigma-70 factor (ECF subfamily)
VVERARAGERGAIALLYRQHAPRLQRFFLARLAGRPEQAEDLTAEVFLRALERLDGYECRGLPFEAWLFRIARNLLVDHQRARPRSPYLPLDECKQDRTRPRRCSASWTGWLTGRSWPARCGG